MVKTLKSENGKYHCILGLSGGIDSSYMALWAYRNKINPLIVHMDNGWNSRESVENIEIICKTFGFELKTLVLPWDIFKKMQVAYLRAGIIDLEVVTDHAIVATLRKISKENNINYVLSGYNDATEMVLPTNWYFDAKDFANIKDICAQYAEKINWAKYPKITFKDLLMDKLKGKTMRFLAPLDLMDYNLVQVKKELVEAMPSYHVFPGKHNESLITRFYQEYILRKKYGIEKRKAHLSNLICSEQITKEEGLEILKTPYYSDNEIEDLKEFFIKKLDLTESEFEDIMNAPARKHEDFKSNQKNWQYYYAANTTLKRLGMIKK